MHCSNYHLLQVLRDECVHLLLVAVQLYIHHPLFCLCSSNSVSDYIPGEFEGFSDWHVVLCHWPAQLNVNKPGSWVHTSIVVC